MRDRIIQIVVVNKKTSYDESAHYGGVRIIDSAMIGLSENGNLYKLDKEKKKWEMLIGSPIYISKDEEGNEYVMERGTISKKKKVKK